MDKQTDIREQMIKIFNYLLISNIFTGAFVYNWRFFDFYINYIFLASFLIFYIFLCKKIHFKRSFLYIILTFFILSLINVLQGNNSILLLLKVLIGFIINAIPYYLLIRLNGNKVDGLFRIYLRIACVAAIIGVLQEISFLFGFEHGYDFRYYIPRTIAPHIQSGLLQVTSIMQEPTHFGTVMIPAFFIAARNLLKWENIFISKKSSFLIIISTLLTLSITVYVGILAVFILIVSNYKKTKFLYACLVVLLGVMFASYRYLPSTRMKVNDTIYVITGRKPLIKANLSTFAFCSNGFVTYKVFMRNPLFGSGLGSHQMSYDRYIGQVIDPAKNRYPLNREDASGLFFRLISETGLLGVILFFYFIFKFYVPRKEKNEEFWIVSNAIICLFILYLLRQGNYFYNGFMFFILAYYFNYKNSVSSLKV